MVILTTKSGLDVLNFVHCDTPQVPEADSDILLTWTMVVARYGDGFVSAYNFNREQWELPAGGIELGESPVECARRELMEESSQIAGRLVCKGLFKGWLYGKPQPEYAAVFFTKIETLQPFIPNIETNRMRIWRTDDPDEMSTELSRWVVQMVTKDG